MNDHRNQAVLLLGPTGSGKTPLGELLERRGLGGRACVHFDFGAHLRQIVEQPAAHEAFSPEAIAFLRRVLQSGALLEKRHFPLAMRILRRFLASRDVDRHALVVLNGLPRHLGQVEVVDAVLDVVALVHLDCPEQTVLARLESNIGGDRSGRSDDHGALVRNKLAVFAQRTAPLVEHYASRGAALRTVKVTANMSPECVWQTLTTLEQ